VTFNGNVVGNNAVFTTFSTATLSANVNGNNGIFSSFVNTIVFNGNLVSSSTANAITHNGNVVGNNGIFSSFVNTIVFNGNLVSSSTANTVTFNGNVVGNNAVLTSSVTSNIIAGVNTIRYAAPTTSTYQWPTNTNFYNSANSMMILYAFSSSSGGTMKFYETYGNYPSALGISGATTNEIAYTTSTAAGTLFTFEVPYGFSFNGVWSSVVWNTIVLH
jgi:hypothetical protein